MLTETLNQFPFTRNVDFDGLSRLAQIINIELVRRDMVLTERGAPGREVFMLLSGECLAVVASMAGKEVVTDRLLPGSLFGELSVLDGGARVRSVRAVRPSEIGRIPAAAFNGWLADHPQAMRDLLADMAGRIRLATDRLFELSVMDVETRVRRYLVRALIEAGQLQDGGMLDPAPSHGLIAAHVGANREAVSRAVGVFRRAGMIETTRLRLVVRDARALETGV